MQKNFQYFWKKLKWCQHQKISLYTSVNLNSERESHVLETLNRDPSWKNNFTSPKDMFKKHRQDCEHSYSQLLFCHICFYHLLEKLDVFFKYEDDIKLLPWKFTVKFFFNSGNLLYIKYWAKHVAALILPVWEVSFRHSQQDGRQ